MQRVLVQQHLLGAQAQEAARRFELREDAETAPALPAPAPHVPWLDRASHRSWLEGEADELGEVQDREAEVAPDAAVPKCSRTHFQPVSFGGSSARISRSRKLASRSTPSPSTARPNTPSTLCPMDRSVAARTWP